MTFEITDGEAEYDILDDANYCGACGEPALGMAHPFEFTKHLHGIGDAEQARELAQTHTACAVNGAIYFHEEKYD